MNPESCECYTRTGPLNHSLSLLSCFLIHKGWGGDLLLSSRLLEMFLKAIPLPTGEYPLDEGV